MNSHNYFLRQTALNAVRRLVPPDARRPTSDARRRPRVGSTVVLAALLLTATACGSEPTTAVMPVETAPVVKSRRARPVTVVRGRRAIIRDTVIANGRATAIDATVWIASGNRDRQNAVRTVFVGANARGRAWLRTTYSEDGLPARSELFVNQSAVGSITYAWQSDIAGFRLTRQVARGEGIRDSVVYVPDQAELTFALSAASRLTPAETAPLNSGSSQYRRVMLESSMLSKCDSAVAVVNLLRHVAAAPCAGEQRDVAEAEEALNKEGIKAIAGMAVGALGGPIGALGGGILGVIGMVFAADDVEDARDALAACQRTSGATWRPNHATPQPRFFT